ncbi:transcriptional regulator [Mycobacterium sp. JS623]|nr:transcriptional regulator [Mycobacterium sp. JS623]
MGADSAETRARILRAAREVINERGYEAANFQAIASRADLSRPTMHYYFHSREEIYDCLVAEAYSIVADCIAQAKRQETLMNQLTTFATAAHRSGFANQSMLRFVITARLESHRSPSLRDNPGPVVAAMQAFYVSVVDEAMVRGEIPAQTDAPAVVSMLLATFLGMGFYAGFIVDQNNMAEIAKQLHRLMKRGLLDQQQNGHTLSFTPPVPATVGGEEFPHAWTG